MSHFTVMQISALQAHEKELVAALEERFGKGNVEVHTEAVPLLGVSGDDRSLKDPSSPDYAPPCHIVVRRTNVGPSANDLGFVRTPDGHYNLYVSNWDKGRNFTPAHQQQLRQRYAAGVTTKTMKSQGFEVETKTTKTGAVRLRCIKWEK